jgi:hypothetical protein
MIATQNAQSSKKSFFETKAGGFDELINLRLIARMMAGNWKIVRELKKMHNLDKDLIGLRILD